MSRSAPSEALLLARSLPRSQARVALVVALIIALPMMLPLCVIRGTLDRLKKVAVFVKAVWE